MESLLFSVGLFHPLQCAGLSRRSPSPYLPCGSGWKGKISVVSGAKSLGEGRFQRLGGLSCEQRADRFHSRKATSSRKWRGSYPWPKAALNKAPSSRELGVFCLRLLEHRDIGVSILP